MAKTGVVRTNLVLTKKAYILLQIYALRERKDKSEIVSRLLEEVLGKRLDDIEKQFAERLLNEGQAGSPKR